MFLTLRKLLFLSILLCLFQSSFSQTLSFKNSTLKTYQSEQLKKNFSRSSVFQLPGKQLSELINEPDFDYEIKLDLGNDNEWHFELYPVDLFAENAQIRVLSEHGEMLHPVPRNIAFRGHIKGNTQQLVSLIVHEDYVYGHITDGEERTYITSLKKYISDAEKDQYVVYRRSDKKTTETGSCGLDIHPEFNLQHEKEHHAHSHGNGRSMTGQCYDVELGIVSDYSIFVDKGSTVQGAINHAISVMSDVETDYEISDFDDALEFEIVEQVVSICEFCDEWTGSTDPSELLSEFANWSVNGGFNNSVDMGQFWTNRDFDGTTVGLAYRSSGLLCNFAYHVLQDFTADADFLRVMTSHEIGHNLNAVHDAGSGDIMAATVSNTNTWSATSVSTIDGIVDAAVSSSCLSTCAATPCAPVTNVSISNITTTGFDISWTATPESSYRVRVRDENDFSIIYTSTPVTSSTMTINPAGWEICHNYMVIVENNCAGTYSAPVSTIVSDSDGGCAEFTADNQLDWGALTVNFTDESIGATSWSWDFGDGGSSTSQNPSHSYTSPGAYEVALTVNSGAHTMTKTNYIYVLPTGQALPYTAADGGNMDDNDFGTISLTSGKSSLFEKGVPSNYFTNLTNCWVTDLDGNISRDDNESVLYTPSFDFSSVVSATLSFDLGMEIQFSNGPFAIKIEYSTNDGSTWTRLGSDTDANWYNRGPNSAGQIATSIFADETGWTYTLNSFNWTYDVGTLSGNSSVIFRFLFTVDDAFGGGYTRAGAMIDNFEISATLLPVELAYFDGHKKDDQVVLSWKTMTEINNDYFLIEKSTDGILFETLGRVSGKGNTLEPQLYELIDRSPALGVNYYRLSQYDFDGTFEMEDEIIAVEFAGDMDISIQPNPVKEEEISLIYQTENEGALEVLIYDMAGQLIQFYDFQTLKGMNQFELELDLPANGVYYLKTRQGNTIQNLKFIKM